MSDREEAASSEGEGEVIRPYGEPDPDRDSSDESDEDDPEEARRIAEGFIVDGDDDEEEDEDEEDDETRRRRRRESKKRKRRRERERRRREEEELSEDDLELLNENAGYGGSSRPLKRLRRRSGSEEGDTRLQGMFDDDDERMGDDDDDLADFIEEDEDEEQTRNETEEQRKQRKREEKQRRREAARARPELAGVDKDSWNEIFDVFGDGHDYDWALEGEEGMEMGEYDDEPAKKDLRLEDVFDPAEIKERRLQDEDRAIAQVDRPERHQLVNSTLSDNPIIVPDTLYPPPEVAAGWAYNRIGTRTQYLFCGNADTLWPEPTAMDPDPMPAAPRLDLQADYISAVSTALNMMFVLHLEVPYLWHYKRDAFSVLENQGQSSVQFLDREDLWTLYSLGIRFRAIWQRCEAVKELWGKIQARRPEVEDDYLTGTLLPSVCNLSIEAAAEGAEWLAYHYAEDLRLIKEEEAVEDGGKRLPERNRDSEMRRGPIMNLVKAFGINVPEIATAFNVIGGDPIAPPPTPEKMPNDLAEEFCGEGTLFHTAVDALTAAKRILVAELARDPSIRQQSREFVDACALVSTTPTDRGMTVIDQYHAYYTFKFLTNKPVDLFKNTPQFLHILKAEEEGLLKIEFTLQQEGFASYLDALKRCVQSKDYSEIAQSWNGEREEVIDTVVNKGYIPAATRWLKEHMRTQAEVYVAERCREELEFRVNMRPYSVPRKMALGETPSVLAITVGQGTVHDAVLAVLVDQEGTVRSPRKFDNLRDPGARMGFIDLVEKRRPHVVVIGGLSVQTGRLRDDAQSALREYAIRQLNDHHPEMRQPVSENYGSHEEFQDAMADFDAQLQRYTTPLVFVNDATARLYMNSEEAAKEHPELPVNGRFALGLARYAQNPLNAYCRLGRRIADVTYVEHHQKLVSSERLLTHLERGLVNSVCAACLEVNSAVTDPYARAMVPFVAGLGPRKGDVLVNAITKHGPLLNRMQLSEFGTFGPTIFENVAGFLCIDNDVNEFRLEKEENPSEQPEPLDMTRIHPEDYEFAQKMCQDALDLDAEDVADQHKSQVVVQLMQDADRERKLSELNLDDFAFNLQRQGEGNKRHTLGAIVSELISWRADRRPPFYTPTDWEVLTMLTGETERTIGPGLRVTATVRKALSGRAFCQLETGLDAVLEREYVSDDPVNSVDEVLNRGQAITAVILEPLPARFQVKISTRHSDLVQSQPFMQPFRNEEYNDIGRQHMAEDMAAQKRARKAGSVKRVVNHPNWHVMNSGQAEQFLAGMTRGDVVVRPSSKGIDHLAVTWKVDEDVYQHIDVQEIDKPHEHALGRILRIGGKYSYSDLDDLIINHVKAIARKFDEMVVNDKYKREDELEGFLNYVQAHPGKSNYGFSIDSDRPGYLKLAFLNKSTKDGGQIQTWPVKVLPGAYQLNSAEVPGVTELCNAFKAQYSSRLSEQGLGGRTPGIRAGGRTPGGRTPGMRAPGGTTPYGGGRTPAAGYGQGGRTPMRPPAHGPPGPGGPPGPPGGFGGYGAPPPPPAHFNQYQGGPPPPPAGNGGGGSGGGMNPERAAMIARSNGGY